MVVVLDLLCCSGLFCVVLWCVFGGVCSVKSICPIEENSLQYDENDNNNMSDETECETNYSINIKWNNTRNKHLTKHDTNDDVDLDNCVVHSVL